jgi:hypothetical protein
VTAFNSTRWLLLKGAAKKTRSGLARELRSGPADEFKFSAVIWSYWIQDFILEMGALRFEHASSKLI